VRRRGSDNDDIIPYACQEEIDVVDFMNLLDKRTKVFQKRLLIVVDEKVEVYSMFPTRQERFAVLFSGIAKNANFQYPTH